MTRRTPLFGRRGPRYLIRVQLAASFLAVAADSRAADSFWSNSRGDGSGTFSVANNWTPGVPGVNDAAHFGMTTSDFVVPTPYTVAFTSDATNQRLIVEDDRVTFDLNGRTYSLLDDSNTNVALEIGTVAGRSGRLTIADGIVYAPFRTSSSSFDVVVGDNSPSSSGHLTVSTGGILTGLPDIIVTGPNSSLTVSGSGDIVAGDVSIIPAAGSTGAVTVTGAGSSLAARELSFGDGSRFDVTAGGRVDAVGEAIFRDGAANVDGANSLLINTGPLGVGLGFGNEATLNITAGGRVESAGFTIGHNSQSNGTVTIDGVGSTLIGNPDNSPFLEDFGVGLRGHGTLNITGGGLVESERGRIGRFESAVGAVLVDGPGSRWQVNPAVSFGVTVGEAGSGTLTVLNGGQVSASLVQIGAQGELRGDGEIAAPTVENGGRVAPGASTGTLHLTGAYVHQTGGQLDIELGGTAIGAFDKLRVDGAATLSGGAFNVSLIDGFAPQAGAAFDVFDFVSLTGTFATVNLPSLGAALQWDQSQLYTQGMLAVLPVALVGDFDLDVDVDGNDLLVWQRGGSPNANSAVDLAAWRTNYGSQVAVAASGAIPEPSSAWLAIVALSLAGACRARRTMASS